MENEYQGNLQTRRLATKAPRDRKYPLCLRVFVAKKLQLIELTNSKNIELRNTESRFLKYHKPQRPNSLPSVTKT